MPESISVITCIVGIIGCVVGVATFVSAQLTRAKEDGVLIEKVDHLIRSFDEQKQDLREKHSSIERILEEHTIQITDLRARMKKVEENMNHD